MYSAEPVLCLFDRLCGKFALSPICRYCQFYKDKLFETVQTSYKSKLVSSYKIGITRTRLLVCVVFIVLCDHNNAIQEDISKMWDNVPTKLCDLFIGFAFNNLHRVKFDQTGLGPFEKPPQGSNLS